jgi:SOS-response transcriptional repressor LexA
MNNYTFGETIKRLRREKGWTQTDLADKSGISQGSISRIEKDIQTNLTEEVKNKLLNVFKIDDEGFIPPPIRHNKPIPVISWVHAGAFVEAIDSWPVGVSGEDDPVLSNVKTSDRAFGLRIEGDSMLPRFMPGDIVIVDPAVRCNNGSPCVVWVNGEVSLKLFYDEETEIRLVPMNNRYQIIVIPKDSRIDFRVIGKVVDIKPQLDCLSSIGFHDEVEAVVIRKGVIVPKDT